MVEETNGMPGVGIQIDAADIYLDLTCYLDVSSIFFLDAFADIPKESYLNVF